MHRFYVPAGLAHDAVLELPEREAHHAINVLRIRVKERVVVLDGAGSELLCEVQQAGRPGVVLSVVQKSRIPPLTHQVTLIQAVTKGKTMELIVQKATELGVHRIVPVLSERTVAHLEEEESALKIEKWTNTAIEAIKQCGSAWLPIIDAPRKPQTVLASPEKSELNLVASLQDGARHAREYFAGFYAERQRRPVSVSIWVGPEGDFTPAEMNAIRSAGALPITLGQLVLRSETAAIYCVSVLNYELQAT